MSLRPPPRRAVFSDRDGTLNLDVGYLSRIDQLQLIPGADSAVRRVNEAGIPFVVITNQSGVARGLIEPEFAQRGGEHLSALLSPAGARLDGYYLCPHHPQGRPPHNIVCDCRKPAAGLLRRAARELGLRLDGSYMVGDKLSDVETGADLGIRPILVRTGSGLESEARLPSNFRARGGRIFDDISQAVDWLLSQGNR